MPQTRLGKLTLQLFVTAQLVLVLWPGFMLFIPSLPSVSQPLGPMTLGEYLLRISIGGGIICLLATVSIGTVAVWKFRERRPFALFALGAALYEIIFLLVLLIAGAP